MAGDPSIVLKEGRPLSSKALGCVNPEQYEFTPPIAA
jgi:hypothetical protein